MLPEKKKILKLRIIWGALLLLGIAVFAIIFSGVTTNWFHLPEGDEGFNTAYGLLMFDIYGMSLLCLIFLLGFISSFFMRCAQYRLNGKDVIVYVSGHTANLRVDDGQTETWKVSGDNREFKIEITEIGEITIRVSLMNWITLQWKGEYCNRVA